VDLNQILSSPCTLISHQILNLFIFPKQSEGRDTNKLLLGVVPLWMIPILVS